MNELLSQVSWCAIRDKRSGETMYVARGPGMLKSLNYLEARDFVVIIDATEPAGKGGAWYCRQPIFIKDGRVETCVPNWERKVQ